MSPYDLVGYYIRQDSWDDSVRWFKVEHVIPNDKSNVFLNKYDYKLLGIDNEGCADPTYIYEDLSNITIVINLEKELDNV